MDRIEPDVKLVSLKPEDVLSRLNLDLPGLDAVKARADAGDRDGALAALRDHYRASYPLPADPAPVAPKSLEAADGIVNHVFQYSCYEPAAYGDEVQWEWDPRGDIEWVAGVYRFYWAPHLAAAFGATREERYAAAFVDLTTDWIARHRLELRMQAHPVYTHWVDFPWLDIQTGVRATNLCTAFKTLVHADAFTPDFLGILLASLHDHQVKTERIPLEVVHNKAIFEQRGFVNIAATFPEFAESRRWLELARQRTESKLLAQVTHDGVQREWSGGYHSGVMRDAVEIMQKMGTVGIEFSQAYRDRVRKMHDYIFWISTPDLGYPMFGDCSRALTPPDDRSQLSFYPTLVGATDLLGDPKYAALADLDTSRLPARPSHAFKDAGMYTLRSDWTPRQVYMALHCSPPPITSHDQDDNGTFELYACGRWLMTDTGFYTYGHDIPARMWHRQTRVHQTLTLDGRDSTTDGRLLLWQPSEQADTVVVENPSYEGLTHRRTVWFVGKRFFVLLDEAIGTAAGALDLHFQLAPGEAILDTAAHCARTAFDDVNILVWQDPAAHVTMEEEEGWFAWSYGHRTPRKAFRFRHNGPAPAAFLTVLVPWRGTETPTVTTRIAPGFAPGAPAVTAEVETLGTRWQLARDVDGHTAQCKPL